MSLELLTVRRKKNSLRSKNYASESQAYEISRIIYAIPSVCKKDGISDGLVNAEVCIDGGAGNNIVLWVTETVATIEAFDD